ncbi:MAG: 50S ribosomal protein L11 methyltransferase [Gammaproteobacteria bacterium]
MSESEAPWLQLAAVLPDSDVEAAEASLSAVGAVSVTLADAEDTPVLEPGPGEMPLWPRVVVTGLFPKDSDVLALLAALSRVGAPGDWRVCAVAERAWEREWMRDFGPMRFGRRLWVVPRGAPPPADAAVVVLDPGLAFGTGTHPTTAFCLEWLDGLSAFPPGLADATVVDYGCGSGILAIAAVKLGAARAVAVDNDPQALVATTDNARANGVAEHVAACEPADAKRTLGGGPAGFLVANILAGPLAALAPTFADLVAPGGKIALSGILAGQQEPVCAACEPYFRMEAPALRDGWIGLAGTRKGI